VRTVNIVVCVKQVPDTEVERSLEPGDNTVDRASVDGVINYLDEFAIEESLKIAEAQGGEVTILTVGPAKATDSIRKALSMGAHKAVHVLDDAIAGSDAVETSLVLAEALIWPSRLLASADCPRTRCACRGSDAGLRCR
jgi:electron transfer flavoprotein beta subunit